MKPLLAEDVVREKLVFPLGVQPKIDGVRGLTTEGGLTGRSLKKHKNKYTTKFYSAKEYANLDGEIAAASETDPELCRITSSALSTIEGEPFTLWWLFDCLHKNVVQGDYEDRHKYLTDFIAYEQSQGRCGHARVVPMEICNSLAQLDAYHDAWLNMGFEGTCVRALHGKHKEGRSTVTKGELLRIKDFIDGEALITGVVQADHNANTAQTNELGKTFRTSHQDNKIPNGMVGSMQGVVTAEVMYRGQLVLFKGQEITIGPGEMTHEQRKALFENGTLIDSVVKFKFFPKGIKDKPRFPTYSSHRSAADIST